MSSQPSEKTPAIPDGLVRELLREQGLPFDAHVKVSVTTTRVRLNPDGTRTVLSRMNSSAVGRGLASMRRPSKLVAIIMSVLGFLQLSYGVWAGRSDARAASIMHRSESCQLQPASLSRHSVASCQIEKAIVMEAYASSSRSGTTYHVVTLRPDGTRDNTRLTARGAYKFWKRLRPTELIVAQRFVAPGYHLTGEVLALADSAGTAMSRDHPDSGAYPNAVAILMGGLLFAVGIAMHRTAARVSRIS
jgi:hypothetical protein